MTATGWQPIETAPLDGRDVLVCVTHNLPDGSWQTIQWVDCYYGAWERWCDRVDIPFGPTHWMPLPPAPEAA